MGKASIILLYGTSTAGKTTICNELQKQDAAKPLKERLHWAIVGNDLVLDKIYKAATQFCIGEIKKRKESEPLLAQAQKEHSDFDIARAVFFGKLNIDDQILDFKPNEGLEYFRIKLNEFYDKLSPQTQMKFDKQTIEDIRSLVINNSDVFTNYHFPTPDEIELQLFDQAIQNSKSGIPTIIDIVPGPDKSLIDKFFEHLKKSDYSCPTHVALVHCPLHVLTERMAERNRKAIERGDPGDIRNQTFPFHQYADIFGAAKDESARIVGAVKREDVVNAVSSFGKQIVEPNSPKEADELMDKLGFPKDGNQGEIRIAARDYYDRMYNTQAKSTEETAKKLTALATIESEIPARPHPIAEAFKRGREDIKLKKVVTKDEKNTHETKVTKPR